MREAELETQVSSDLAAGRFVALVVLIRHAWDENGDDAFRGGGVNLTALDWVSVAEAIEVEDSLQNLAGAYWQKDGLEPLAERIMRLAFDMGSVEAGRQLAEWLAWLGRPSEAIFILQSILASDPDQQDVAGQLGRLKFEARGKIDDDVVGLLEMASKANPSFDITHAEVLIAREQFAEARSILERLSAMPNADAAIMLGNLLLSEFDDEIGAERAYQIGIDCGEPNARYNLGALRIDQGRIREGLLLQRGVPGPRENLD